MPTVINEITIDSGDGGYVRWRNRMVRLSALDDLKQTLTTTGWMAAPLTFPLEVKEFFPEFAIYANDSVHVNTMTISEAEPLPLHEYEVGGMYSRLYRINLAFYSQDDETGISLFNDLSDRFEGITDSPYLSLYNYNVTGTPPLITRMEVESFQYQRAPGDTAPYEHHLWFGELMVRDFVSGDRTVMPT